MLRFKNRAHVSVTPKFWQSPTGKRIEWRADTVMFNQFVALVWSYCDQNGIERPTEEALEDLMCQQSPARDCTGDANYHQPVSQKRVASGRSGECKTCGRSKAQ
jgi:hypothetical protein